VRQIHDALARHIQREEGEIFPRIARAWSRDRLEQAGAEMSDMQAGKTARP
jgi:hemerythrin-like domain-containing protein